MSTELSIETNSGLSLFDTGIFEQMGLIASKLAASSLIPETLRTEKKNGQAVALPPEQVAANCFRIVEQSQRWGMSPFAVIDCASVVYGKLMWEGKVIAAALESTMGIRLDYDYSGQGEGRAIIVSGRFPDEEKIRQVEGNVKNWKTDQWKATDYDQRLAYRGAREWARRHAPGVILGVYSPDEIEESPIRQASGHIVDDRPVNENPYGKIAGGESKDDAEAPKVEVKQPEGNQTKARFVDTVELIDISDAKTSGKKTWWTAQVKTQAGATVEMSTFSESMHERLSGRIGDTIKVTFTQTPKGGFAFEDFEEADLERGVE